MTRVREVLLGRGPTQLGDTALRALAKSTSRGRLADVTIRWPNGAVDEQGFAPEGVDPRSGHLKPRLDVVSWRGVHVVIGLLRLLVFGPKHKTPARVDLFRDVAADPGFHHVEAFTSGPRLVLVYEGGVVGIADDGEVAWHHAKNWDDVLVGVTGPALRFEGVAGEWTLDANTGDKAGTWS